MPHVQALFRDRQVSQQRQVVMHTRTAEVDDSVLAATIEANLHQAPRPTTGYIALAFHALACTVFPPTAVRGIYCVQLHRGDQRAQVVLEQNRVHLANSAAMSAGIVPGCSLATAHSIEPSLEHFRRDSSREAIELQKLAESLYCFSSLVSLAPPDSIVLEIHGSLKLYTQADLLMAAKQLCQKLGFSCLTGVADTATAAITLARSQSRRLNDALLSHCGLEHQHTKTVIEQLANMGSYIRRLLSCPEAK